MFEGILKPSSCGHFCNRVTPCGHWLGPTWQCFHSPFHSLPSFSAHWWATWNLSPASLLLSLPPSLSLPVWAEPSKVFFSGGCVQTGCAPLRFMVFFYRQKPRGWSGALQASIVTKKNPLVITTLVSKLLWQYWVAIYDYIKTQPLSQQSSFEFNLHWNLMIYIYFFSFNNT